MGMTQTLTLGNPSITIHAAIFLLTVSVRKWKYPQKSTDVTRVYCQYHYKRKMIYISETPTLILNSIWENYKSLANWLYAYKRVIRDCTISTRGVRSLFPISDAGTSTPFMWQLKKRFTHKKVATYASFSPVAHLPSHRIYHSWLSLVGDYAQDRIIDVPSRHRWFELCISLSWRHIRWLYERLSPLWYSHGGRVVTVTLHHRAIAYYTTNWTNLVSSITHICSFCLIVTMLKVQSSPFQYIALPTPLLSVTDL